MQFARKLHARNIVRTFMILVIIVVSALLWLNSWSNKPTGTTIHITQPHDTSTTTPAYQVLSTDYFKTEIPSDWHIQTTTTDAHRSQSLAYAPNGQSGQVGITNGAVPSDGLQGVSDYNLRATNTAVYSRVADPTLPAGAELFTTRDGPPTYTVFLVHDGRYTTVSISKLSSLDTTHDFLVHILNSWQWPY